MTAIHGVRGGSRGEQAIDGRKITTLGQQHQGGVGRRGRLSLFRGRLGTGCENEQAPEDGAQQGEGGGQCLHGPVLSVPFWLAPMRSRKRVAKEPRRHKPRSAEQAT